jgi:hypothetical protein
MIRSVLTAALFLSACGDTVTSTQPIPAELVEPVEVRCESGTTERALGECALRLRAGLDTANSKLSSIKELVRGDDD